MTAPPTLSVVVTIVDGGAALRRCLTALFSQQDAPAIEVLLPYDGSIASVSEWAGEFPDVRFLPLGDLVTRCDAATVLAQHELFDRRRSAGLAAARGELVAIVEDRGIPRPDWAAAIVRLHRRMPNGAIGGAVENGRDEVLNWAVYYCDFGRYQLPFLAGPRRYITDVNVAYKRRAVEQTREIWQTRYHEPLVHWALESAGETLLLSPEFVVEQIRDDLTLTGLLAERLAWGRLFGSLRVRDVSGGRRFVFAAISPVVPVVLFVRFLRDRWLKGAPLSRVLRVAPIALVLLCAWSAGEAVAYLTGKA